MQLCPEICCCGEWGAMLHSVLLLIAWINDVLQTQQHKFVNWQCDTEYRGDDFTAAVTLGNPDVLVGSGNISCSCCSPWLSSSKNTIQDVMFIFGVCKIFVAFSLKTAFIDPKYSKKYFYLKQLLSIWIYCKV